MSTRLEEVAAAAPRKPILCLDFDGVLHSYTSGWKGADVIPDPPVPGWLEFIAEADKHFEVHIYSSRSNRAGGIEAMQDWVWKHATNGAKVDETVSMPAAIIRLKWPIEKPAAMVTIDDRALTFTGVWPDIAALLAFKPWNKP